MTCDLPPRQCLWEHVRPHLEECAESLGQRGQYRARCPAHPDRKPSLSIRLGDRGHIVWHCHAGCADADVRGAMVRQGVPDDCLRHVRDQRTEDELVSALTAILETERPGPARDLLIATVLWNRGKLPRGKALENLGKRAGLSRSTVYRATFSPTSGTKHDGYTTDTQSQFGTGSPNLGPEHDGLTRGFGVTVAPGVENSVDPEPPGSLLRDATVSDWPRRCELAGCGRELGPLARANRRFCSTSCRQKAARRARRTP